MVRFKNRYILVELEFASEEGITDVTSKDLLETTRDSISYNYGDLGGAKVAFSLQVKYFNGTVGLAIIRVAREYISLLANSITFITTIKGRKVKLRQLHCSGTIKKSEVKARALLSLWLNNVLKKIATNKIEEQELKKSIEKEFETLAAMEQ